MEPQLSKFEEAIDRIFDRLSATWGRDFMNQWEGLKGDKIKAAWAHELSGYNPDLKPNPELVSTKKLMQPIAWALENLPEKPLNAIQFRALCQRAPAPVMLRLPEPAADPDRVAAELDKLAPARQTVASAGPVDHKAWARRLVANHAAGICVSVGPLRFAREALGLPTDRVHA